MDAVLTVFVVIALLPLFIAWLAYEQALNDPSSSRERTAFIGTVLGKVALWSAAWLALSVVLALFWFLAQVMG